MMIEHDKVLHLVYGLFLAVPFIGLWMWRGFFICLFIILGKEFIWDKLLGNGLLESLDILYSLLPCVLFILLLKLNRYYEKKIY